MIFASSATPDAALAVAFAAAAAVAAVDFEEDALPTSAGFLLLLSFFGTTTPPVVVVVAAAVELEVVAAGTGLLPGGQRAVSEHPRRVCDPHQADAVTG